MLLEADFKSLNTCAISSLPSLLPAHCRDACLQLLLQVLCLLPAATVSPASWTLSPLELDAQINSFISCLRIVLYHRNRKVTKQTVLSKQRF